MRKNTPARKILKHVNISRYQSIIHLFQERLRDQNLKEHSIKNYVSSLIIFLAWCVLFLAGEAVEKLTYDDYREFLKYLDQDHLAPRTINVYIAMLKKFHYFVRGMTWNHYEIPFRRYDKKLPAVPEVEEAAKIISACISSFDFALVTLLLSTGIRISEACTLVYRDIQRARKEIYIHPGKGRMDRYVPLDDSTLAALEKLCREQIDFRRKKGLPAIQADSPIFFFKDGITPANTNLLRRHFKKVVSDAGLGSKGYNPHSCRHYFALNVYLQQYDLALVKNLLGHKTLNATEVYLRLAAVKTMAEKGYTNPLQLCLKAGGIH